MNIKQSPKKIIFYVSIHFLQSLFYLCGNFLLFHNSHRREPLLAHPNHSQDPDQALLSKKLKKILPKVEIQIIFFKITENINKSKELSKHFSISLSNVLLHCFYSQKKFSE